MSTFAITLGHVMNSRTLSHDKTMTKIHKIRNRIIKQILDGSLYEYGMSPYCRKYRNIAAKIAKIRSYYSHEALSIEANWLSCNK